MRNEDASTQTDPEPWVPENLREFLAALKELQAKLANLDDNKFMAGHLCWIETERLPSLSYEELLREAKITQVLHLPAFLRQFRSRSCR